MQELRKPDFCDAGLSSAKIKEIRKIIDFLLSKGADVKAGNNMGMTPLHVTESYEIAKILIDHGADVNARDLEGETPLHKAGSYRIAQLLIANGADVNAKDAGERTPLSWALFCQHYYGGEDDRLIIELLKDKGGHENVYAFFDALERKDTTRMCELLKENPKLVNCLGRGEYTPLTKAIEDNNCRMVEFLLDRGANVRTRRYPISSLAVAVSNNSVAVTKLLISKEKCRHEYGELLMTSLERGYNNITSLLLQSGADVNFRNSAGETPSSHGGGVEGKMRRCSSSHLERSKDRRSGQSRPDASPQSCRIRQSGCRNTSCLPRGRHQCRRQLWLYTALQSSERRQLQHGRVSSRSGRRFKNRLQGWKATFLHCDTGRRSADAVTSAHCSIKWKPADDLTPSIERSLCGCGGFKRLDSPSSRILPRAEGYREAASRPSRESQRRQQRRRDTITLRARGKSP